MAYTVPRVEITQEFLQVPTLVDNPLAAFVFGPNYTPIRYEVAAEKGYTSLGAYVPAAETVVLKSYPYLAYAPGLTVDTNKDHLTVYLEDAFACYFSSIQQAKGTVANAGNGTNPGNAPDSAGSYALANAVVLDSNHYYTNKVAAKNVYFANGVNPTSGTLYPRSPFFSNRDVQVGDWVAVTGTSQGGEAPVVTVFTQVTGVSANSLGMVNILETADPVFGPKTGTYTNLIDPNLSTATFALFLHKTVVAPDSIIATTTTNTQIGLNPGAYLTDPALVDGDSATGALGIFPIGVPVANVAPYAAVNIQPAGLVPATARVAYRVLRVDNASQIHSLHDPAAVEAVLGPVTPENPLAQGVYDAALNSGGVPVYYMAVPTDDLTGYNKVLTQASRSSLVYGLVPLTFDRQVQDAVIAHVETMSSPTQAKWRKAWICLKPTAQGTFANYDRSGVGEQYWTINTVGDDPQATGVDEYITIDSTNNVNPRFVTTGVVAGDILRAWDATTTTGTHSDYTITRVAGQNILVVNAAVTQTADKAIQIIRNFSNIEQVDQIGGASHENRRVNAVFPAYCKTAGVTKEGFYLAAALAGLRGSSLPHRPLTNVEVLGFDDLTDSLITFTPDELDRLAAYGYWIVTQDTPGGVAYTRHQLTTAGYTETGDDPKFSEDSVTTNVDSISFSLQRALSPFIGKYNVNPATVSLIQAAILAQLDYRVAATGLSIYGPQLLSYSVDRIGTSPVFKDRIVANVSLAVPIALNKVSVTLVVP